ncbi:hypothetical protein M0R19_02010 [Candidatus Pacearchaeota archaeon]|nr:hypothetical protein [Candidatus Pacearchaeota archaeon]
MRILFICKYNAFRSRIAEEYLKKINQNPDVEVISEGLIMDGRADAEQVTTARELLDIDISQREPEPLNLDDLEEADKIIVVADDIPKIIFNYKKNLLMKKIEFWGIKDEQFQNTKNINKIVLKIKKKVEELNKKLEKGK